MLTVTRLALEPALDAVLIGLRSASGTARTAVVSWLWSRATWDLAGAAAGTKGGIGG